MTVLVSVKVWVEMLKNEEQKAVADAGEPRDVTNGFTRQESELVTFRASRIPLAGAAETKEEREPKAITALRMRDMVGNEDQTPELPFLVYGMLLA